MNLQGDIEEQLLDVEVKDLVKQRHRCILCGLVPFTQTE